MRPYIYPQLYIIAGGEADADRIRVVQNRHWSYVLQIQGWPWQPRRLVDSICFGRSALGGWEEAPGRGGKRESSQNRQLEHDPDFSALHLTA